MFHLILPVPLEMHSSFVFNFLKSHYVNITSLIFRLLSKFEVTGIARGELIENEMKAGLSV